MCDVVPDDERRFRDRLTLAEIGEALASLPQRADACPSDCAPLDPVRRATKPKPLAARLC